MCFSFCWFHTGRRCHMLFLSFYLFYTPRRCHVSVSVFTWNTSIIQFKRTKIEFKVYGNLVRKVAAICRGLVDYCIFNTSEEKPLPGPLLVRLQVSLLGPDSKVDFNAVMAVRIYQKFEICWRPYWRQQTNHKWFCLCMYILYENFVF